MGIRQLILSVLTLALSACGAFNVPQPTELRGFYALDQEIQAWPEGSQINFVFAENFPFRLRRAVQLGATAYNDILASVQLDADIESEIPHIADPEQASGDGKHGIYWIEEPWPWEASHPDSDAMTLVRFQDGRIIEADVFFRARSYLTRVEVWATTSEDRGSRLPSDRRATEISEMPNSDKWLYLIGIHEFGHALGRAHADEEHDSIMRPSVSLDLLMNPFSDYDLEILGTVYKLR